MSLEKKKKKGGWGSSDEKFQKSQKKRRKSLKVRTLPEGPSRLGAERGTNWEGGPSFSKVKISPQRKGLVINRERRRKRFVPGEEKFNSKGEEDDRESLAPDKIRCCGGGKGLVSYSSVGKKSNLRVRPKTPRKGELEKEGFWAAEERGGKSTANLERRSMRRSRSRAPAQQMGGGFAGVLRLSYESRV